MVRSIFGKIKSTIASEVSMWPHLWHKRIIFTDGDKFFAAPKYNNHYDNYFNHYYELTHVLKVGKLTKRLSPYLTPMEL